MLKITLKRRQINSLQRIFAIRGAENNSARVSAAREARMTAFVTQSSDVFNENGRLTTESTTTDDDANVGRRQVTQRTTASVTDQRHAANARRTNRAINDNTAGIFYVPSPRGWDIFHLSFTNSYKCILVHNFHSLPVCIILTPCAKLRNTQITSYSLSSYVSITHTGDLPKEKSTEAGK